MNPGVNFKIEGLPELLRRFDGLKPAKINQIVRKGLEKAARIEANAIKAQLQPGGRGVDTGAMRKATAFKVKTGKTGRSYAVIGAQRSAKRVKGAPVATKFSLRLKGRQKGKAPANYAHLIEYGHRIAHGGTLHRLSGKAASASKRTGKIGEGTSTGFVFGIGFMGHAERVARAAALESIKTHLQEAVKQLAIKGK